MFMNVVRPKTLNSVKRRAKEIKKQLHIKHSQALDVAAREASCENFRHAQRILPPHRLGGEAFFVYLTIYWLDDKNNKKGRETLRISLSRPILDICSKSYLKHLRGFHIMRMVASDHFVSDELAHSQERARELICKAVRSLTFVEHTGLLPSRKIREAYPGGSSETQLPGNDHATYWEEPLTGQFVIVDEPYPYSINMESDRAEWADRYGWRICKSSWGGMYFPYCCGFYLATDCRQGYDIEGLVEKIDSAPPPLLAGNWVGDSVSTFAIFVSPAARTKQDRRRARSKGTVFPKPSATTIPYGSMFGGLKRRPAGAAGVKVHKELGGIIKAVLRSRIRSFGVYQQMNALRSTLEDWMSCELMRGELEENDFFKVYYGEIDDDNIYAARLSSKDDLVKMMRSLKEKIMRSYPNCAPLRRQIKRIERAISLA